MTIYRIILLALESLFLAPVQAQPLIRSVNGFHHPESVIQFGNSLFVSDIGKEMEPVKKDGDGCIGKIDLSTGKLIDSHFLPVSGVLHAPKGMAMDGQMLYVADVDRVVGFDVVTRKQMDEIVIKGTGFLNDLVTGNGKMYASATDNGKIYEIDWKSHEYHALPIDSIGGANGLYFEKGHLYCVAIGNFAHPDGSLYDITISTHAVKKLADYQGLLDGVAIAGNTLYFSDWRQQDHGVILSLNLTSNELKVLPLPEIAGPADFTVSKDGRYLIIPEMLTGKIVFWPL